MKKARFGITLITKFASRYLDVCLNSFFENKTLDVELSVVADNPSWQVIKILQEHKLKYTVVDNGNFWLNCNTGIAKLNTEYVGISNDDIVYGPDWDLAIEENLDPDNYVSLMTLCENAGQRFSKDGSVTTIDNFDYASFKKYSIENRKDIKYSMPIYATPNICASDRVKSVGGYVGCCHHGYGECITERLVNKYRGSRCWQSFYSYVWHFGAANNADRQDALYVGPYFNTGLVKCAKCGFERTGFHHESRECLMLWERGFWYCNNCKG